MDWTHVAEGRDRWRAYMNTAMNVCVPKGRQIYRIAERQLASEGAL